MKEYRMTVVVAAMAMALCSAIAYGADAVAAPNAVTIDAVKKGIVGVWNGVGDEGNMHNSYVISFDAQGRITEKGFASGGMLLGEDGPRKGKVKYRLEANKDGAGVVIVEIDEKGTESPMYIVDKIDEKTVTMRSIDSQTKKAKETVSWKRIKTEPYPIESGKQPEKKAE